MMDIDSTAAALYDGGWRSTDLDQLAAEYDLPQDDAQTICDRLASMETDH